MISRPQGSPRPDDEIDPDWEGDLEDEAAVFAWLRSPADKPSELVPSGSAPLLSDDDQEDCEDGSSTWQDSRYEDLEELASGGMGVVWKVYDHGVKRRVAVKKLRSEYREHPECLHQFQEEIHHLGCLEHPNIVPIYDVLCDEDERPQAYAMRLMSDKTLSQAIAAYHLDPSPKKLRKLIEQLKHVGSAVAYAHSQDVWHCDLKPENVLLGEHAQTMVADFGLAMAPNREGRARQSLSGGTLEYMAPEQADERLPVDCRTDIYLLGAILFEILTDSPPRSFRDASDSSAADQSARQKRQRERLREIAKQESPLVKSRCRGADPALSAICEKAMRRRPSQRYQTAAEFVEELEQWLADEPVRAYPEPLLKRLRRFWGRHQKAGWILIVGALLSGLCFYGGTELQQQYAQLAKQAEARREWSQARGYYLQTQSYWWLGVHNQTSRDADSNAERMVWANELETLVNACQCSHFLEQDGNFPRSDLRAYLDRYDFSHSSPASSLWTHWENQGKSERRVGRELREQHVMLLFWAAEREMYEASKAPEEGAAKHWKQAQAWLQRAKQWRPESLILACYLRECGDQLGQRRLEGKPLFSPPREVDEHFVMSDVYRRSERWEDAAAHYNHILNQNPQDYWARLMAAWCCLRLQKHQEAFYDYTEAIRLGPKMPEQQQSYLAWAYLGRAKSWLQRRDHNDLDRYKNARGDLKNAARLLDRWPSRKEKLQAIYDSLHQDLNDLRADISPHRSTADRQG